MTDIIIHDITVDEFAEYDNGGVGYLIGTGRVDEVKHGLWVHNKWSNMRHDYSCSLCGCRIEGVDPFSLSATTYNYCPECGAKMDEVEDG